MYSIWKFVVHCLIYHRS